MMMMMLFATLLAILTAIGDGLTTVMFRALGGYEENPAMRFLERKIGLIPGIILLKLAMFAVVLFGLLPLGRYTGTSEHYLWLVWLPIIGLQAYAIQHNWKLIRHLKARKAQRDVR